MEYQNNNMQNNQQNTNYQNEIGNLNEFENIIDNASMQDAYVSTPQSVSCAFEIKPETEEMLKQGNPYVIDTVAKLQSRIQNMLQIAQNQNQPLPQKVIIKVKPLFTKDNIPVINNNSYGNVLKGTQSLVPQVALAFGNELLILSASQDTSKGIDFFKQEVQEYNAKYFNTVNDLILFNPEISDTTKNFYDFLQKTCLVENAVKISDREMEDIQRNGLLKEKDTLYNEGIELHRKLASKGISVPRFQLSIDVDDEKDRIYPKLKLTAKPKGKNQPEILSINYSGNSLQYGATKITSSKVQGYNATSNTFYDIKNPQSSVAPVYYETQKVATLNKLVFELNENLKKYFDSNPYEFEQVPSTDGRMINAVKAYYNSDFNQVDIFDKSSKNNGQKISIFIDDKNSFSVKAYDFDTKNTEFINNVNDLAKINNPVIREILQATQSLSRFKQQNSYQQNNSYHQNNGYQRQNQQKTYSNYPRQGYQSNQQNGYPKKSYYNNSQNKNTRNNGSGQERF